MKKIFALAHILQKWILLFASFSMGFLMGTKQGNVKVQSFKEASWWSAFVDRETLPSDTPTVCGCQKVLTPCCRSPGAMLMVSNGLRWKGLGR